MKYNPMSTYYSQFTNEESTSVKLGINLSIKGENNLWIFPFVEKSVQISTKLVNSFFMGVYEEKVARKNEIYSLLTNRRSLRIIIKTDL